MNSIGAVFRSVRKSKNLKMNDICDLTVSHSQLSRFERGTSELTINKFFVLLRNMCLSLDEFQSIYDNYNLSSENSFRQELSLAYDAKDLTRLRKLYTNFDKLYKKEPQKKHYKINSIVIKAVMSDINGRVMASDEEIEFLTEYLMLVEDWGRYEIWVFGNSTKILSRGTLNILSKSLLQKTEFYKNLPSNNKMVYRTVLNLIVYWIENDDLSLALKYINFLENQNISVDYFYEKLMFEYNKGLYKYRSGDKNGLILMNECANIFEKMGFFDKSNSLKKEIENF